MSNKAHIIFAHHNLNSFNGMMRNIAIEKLEKNGWQVTTSDLYQNNFKAIADASDFKSIYNTDYFDLQVEQSMAQRNNTFIDEIKREHYLLENANLIIFQFPLWWYSVPAIMKGYIERIFSVGWAYGGGSALRNKRVLLSLTTGAPQFMWTESQKGNLNEMLKHIWFGTFEACGMKNLEPFIAYGSKRYSEQVKQTVLNDYEDYINSITRI